MENNKNKKSVKFQGDMLNFCDFIQVFVFTRNHHLKFVKTKVDLIPMACEDGRGGGGRNDINVTFYCRTSMAPTPSEP